MLERVTKEYGAPPEFPLLSDVDHKVIDRYGLLNPNPTSRGRTGLPHPSVFVIGGDGKVRWKFVETNHRIRAENLAILQALKQLERE